jgi:hypothetical protein
MSENDTRSFTVVVPEGNEYSDPRAAQRIAAHFKQFKLNAEFVTKNDIPVQDEQGAYTLVTHDQEAAFLAPRLLDQHYGLTPIPN